MKNKQFHCAKGFDPNRFVYLDASPEKSSGESPKPKFDLSKFEKDSEKMKVELEKGVGTILKNTSEKLEQAKLDQNRQAHTVDVSNKTLRIDFKGDKKAENQTRLKDMFSDEFVRVRIGKENQSHPDKQGQAFYAKKMEGGDYYFLGSKERVKIHSGDLVRRMDDTQIAKAKEEEIKLVVANQPLIKALGQYNQEQTAAKEKAEKATRVAGKKPSRDITFQAEMLVAKAPRKADENEEDELASLVPQDEEVEITSTEPVIRRGIARTDEPGAQTGIQFPTMDLRDPNDPRVIAEREAEEADFVPGRRFASKKEGELTNEEITERSIQAKQAKRAKEMDQSTSEGMASLGSQADEKLAKAMKKGTETEQRLAKAPKKGKQPPAQMAGGKSQE